MQKIQHSYIFARKKMSRLDTLFIDFSGKHGYYTAYNKQSKAKYKVDLEDFIYLESFNVMSGYDEKHGWIASNPLKDVQQEKVSVYTQHNGTIASGLYAEIKDRLPQSAKFALQIYGCYATESNVLLQITLARTALQSWINFTLKNPHYVRSTIKIEDPKLMGKGENKYYVPNFSCVLTTAEQEIQAQKIWPLYCDYRATFYQNS
jgi:hypothetical protein